MAQSFEGRKGETIVFRTKKDGPKHRGVIVEVNRWGHAKVAYLDKDGCLMERASWVNPGLEVVE